MHMAFAIRTEEYQALGYSINRGVYYAYSHQINSCNEWYNLQGNTMQAPIINIHALKVFDPAKPGDKYHNPSFAETDNETMHFLTPFQRKSDSIVFYYWKKKGETEFQKNRVETGKNPIMMSTNDTIFLISLKDDRPMIQSRAPTANEFQVEYCATSGPRFINIVPNKWKDENGTIHLFLVGMINGGSSAEKPIRYLHFYLPDTSNW